MNPLSVSIESVAVLGAGFDDWPACAAVLSGQTPYQPGPTVLPIPERLPPAERRRTGRVVKIALAVGSRACAAARRDPASLPAVFASSGGDGHNCHEICQTLASSEREISPTRFHNSVHNAAAGYWSIAMGVTASSNAICAFDASFSAGLLEAATQAVVMRTPVLLVTYDAQYPEPLAQKRPIHADFGVAMVLAPGESVAALAQLTVGLSDQAWDRMSDPGLEALRASIPAARSLPMLQAIASRRAVRLTLEYLDGRGLSVDIRTCR